MDKKNGHTYDASAMQLLDDISHIRLRYGMYIGSADNPTHLAVEILANAIDEANLGYGNKIDIAVDKDGWITIKDEGRGIPHGKDPEGDPIIQSSYDKLHMGGKFDTKAYATSLGLNAAGGVSTNALSEYLIASTSREGLKETVEFKQGRLQKYYTEKISPKEHGVTVKFLPDKEIFKTIKLNMTRFTSLVEELSYLIKGVHFNLDNCGEKQTFYSENGMKDYMDKLCKGEKEIIRNRLYNHAVDESGGEIEIYMTYSDSYDNKIKLFANNGANESGTHLTAFKTTMTRMFNKYAKEHKLLKVNENNLTGAELAEGQILILNLKWQGIVYDSQTKVRVDDSTIIPFVNLATTEMFSMWLEANPKDAEAIIEKALLARRAKDAAKKAREQVRGVKPVKKQNLKHKLAISDKLKDANGTNRKECELFITEGNSAASSAIGARDVKTQAIMSLRGKVLNAEKTDTNKLLENKEISGIIAAIGAGFGKDFDVSKSRYGKIILTTDADKTSSMSL